MQNPVQNRIVDRLILGGIAILLLAFAATLMQSLNDHVAKEGESAPSFTLKTDGGRTISPADFGGKVLVLNFWATWCTPCVEEIPSLDNLQRRFAGQGLVVMGVSIDDDPEAYRAFLDRYKVTFQTVRNHKINADYGTLQVPETYIIDRNGRIVKKIVGKENWNDESVMSYVQSLLS
jgi:cytochrome c biogenesis protein CcmG/thiol:disulfide interchange protein DsbE